MKQEAICVEWSLEAVYFGKTAFNDSLYKWRETVYNTMIEMWKTLS